MEIRTMREHQLVQEGYKKGLKEGTEKNTELVLSVIDKAMKVMNEEFGFGKVRLERFEENLMKELEKED